MAVSSTSVKGFTPLRSIYGVDIPQAFDFILENSSTVTIGDAVRLDTNGAVKRILNTDAGMLGIVTGLYETTGNVGIFSPRVPSTAITGATLTPDDTLATASDNRTNTQKKLVAKVLLDPAGSVLFRNVTNGTLAQSNVGQFFNVVSGNPGQIDQASASNTAGQFQLIALDPDGDGDATKGVFRMVQQQMTSEIQSYGSTQVITA